MRLLFTKPKTRSVYLQVDIPELAFPVIISFKRDADYNETIELRIPIG